MKDLYSFHRDEEDLLRTAKENREYATTNHSWKQFCDTVISFMGL